MDDELDRTRDVITSYARSLAQSAEQAKLKREFDALDRRELLRMDDKQLAEWQASHPPSSAQHLFAEHDWQRRLIARQIRASHITAWVGVIGTLAGVLFGWWLGSAQHRSDPQVQAQSHAASQTDIQKPVAAPPQKPAPASPAPVQNALNPNP